MAKTKYYIKLSDDEKAFLTKIVCEGKESARAVMRAKILLMSDATQPDKLSIKKLADQMGTTDTTIQSVRTAYANDGLEAAVYRKHRVVSRTTRKVNDEVIRQLLEIANSEPPEGKKRWSASMLCNELVERGIVSSISISMVLRILREANQDESQEE